MTIAIPESSTEAVQVPVRMRDGDQYVDPTGFDVFLAFMPAGEHPSSGDWAAAAWTAGTYPRSYAVAVPDVVAGVYDVWIRIDSTVGQIERPAGRMIVT